LSQGLSTIRDSAKDFQRLNAIIQSTAIFQKANNAATAIAITLQKAFGVATVGTGRAFTILKGAIAATGIGLLVVGLTTLIGKISEWTSTSEKAAEAQKKLAEQNEVVNASLQNQIDVLTAVGNKEKEILGLKKQQIENELNVLRTSAKAKGELTLDELKKFRDLKTQKEVLDIEEQNRLKKVDEDAKKKQDEKNKKDIEDYKQLKEQRQQRENDAIEFENEIEELRNERIEKNIKFLEDRENQFNKFREESTSALEKRIATNSAGFLQNQIDTNKKRQDDLILSLKTISEAEGQSFKQQLESYNNLRAAERQRLKDRQATQAELDAFDVETKKGEQQRERANAEVKAQIISGALGAVADAVGRNTIAGKALAVAQATVDTYVGANKALATYPPPFGAIAAGTVILGGLLNVKKIVSTKLPKPPGSKVGGDSIAAPSISAPIVPQTPQAQLTQLDQTTINRMGSATNRTYVLESDVTNSQERITRINRAARLN